LDLPQEVWKRLTWFWGLGFVAIAIVNGYYVRLALAGDQVLYCWCWLVI
jgi:intracellular septation protein A